MLRKIVKKIVQAPERLYIHVFPDFCYFWITFMISERVSVGIDRSFDVMLIFFSSRPLFPVVSTEALICPVAPGSR